MATNNYFNNYPKHVTNEQLLVEDLVLESIKMFGMDVYYLPRTSQDVSEDLLYGDDPVRNYTSAYPIEMYLENVLEMLGGGDFISKFGLEIRDEIQLLVARKRFNKSVPNLIRPREGDLIYVPLVQNMFEISFVEHENNQAMMYTLGRGRGGNVYVYALKLKQLVFSNEIIETGIAEIDGQMRDEHPKTILNLANTSGTFLIDEPVYQGANYDARTNFALVYDYTPNTSITIYRTVGNFAANTIIKGKTSGAFANVSIVDANTVMDTIFEDLADNNRVETESNNILNFNEVNPFGEP